MEILLKKKESARNDFIELWLKYFNDLNIKIINEQIIKKMTEKLTK